MSVISEQELGEILEVVWMTVLELQVTPEPVASPGDEQFLTARIDISGAWEGGVRVRTTFRFLKRAASMVFVKAQNDVVEKDCDDTLTELTNMVGGTIKCLLPEGCDLALPMLEAGDAYSKTPGNWVEFSCEGEPVAILVFEKDETVGMAA